MINYIENKIFNNHLLYREIDPLNPLNLPPYTIRVKYTNNTSPYYAKGTAVQVSQNPNVWDITYNNNNWESILGYKYSPTTSSNIIEVMGANCSNVTSMKAMFYGCYNLSSIALFDTSKVSTMQYMLNGCMKLKTPPLFNTSNVTNMEGMFENIGNISLPLLDTSNVTSMASMFKGSNIKTTPLFDTHNVKDMFDMFYLCNNLTTLPLYDTSNVTNMSYFCCNCVNLTGIPLFNTSSVENMYAAFESCSSVKYIPLLDTRSVKDADYMFNGCRNVEGGALALYNQMRNQATPPKSHYETFSNCGINTKTGSAELAQIPASWK